MGREGWGDTAVTAALRRRFDSGEACRDQNQRHPDSGVCDEAQAAGSWQLFGCGVGRTVPLPSALLSPAIRSHEPSSTPQAC